MLCVADPPYLGRANRWYGDGRGSQGGRHRAPVTHPEAAEWDREERHAHLARGLAATYDGYAIAATAASLPVYLAADPTLRVAVWHKTRSVPSGWRVMNVWEPVLLHIPPSRVSRTGCPWLGRPYPQVRVMVLVFSLVFRAPLRPPAPRLHGMHCGPRYPVRSSVWPRSQRSP